MQDSSASLAIPSVDFIPIILPRQCHRRLRIPLTAFCQHLGILLMVCTTRFHDLQIQTLSGEDIWKTLERTVNKYADNSPTMYDLMSYRSGEGSTKGTRSEVVGHARKLDGVSPSRRKQRHASSKVKNHHL